MSTALWGENGVVGVVSLYSPGADAFTTEHQQVLELVARPVAAAVRRARQFEAECRSDLIDGETGLPNQRYLEHLLTTRGFSESLLMHSLGVLAIEWEGHATDTSALRNLATVTRAAVRVTDLMFRYGERELVVLVPDCGLDTGQLVAERVTASALQALGLDRSAVCVGLACAPGDGDTLSELVQAARARLRRQRGSAALAVTPTRRAAVGEFPDTEQAVPA